MRFIRHLFYMIDDNLNPIVVKELRQAVQSRFVISIVGFFLVGMLGIMGILVMTNMTEGTVTITKGMTLGREAFEILFGVFFFSAIFFIPSYTATRMVKERSEADMDLLFIAIKPSVIIRGKLFAGMCLILILFSICLPFMTFTYLLRGIDLPSVFVILILAFIVITAAIQFALFIASIPCSKVFRSLLGFASAAIMIGVFSSVLTISGQMLRTGVGSRLGTADFWNTASVFLALIGLFSGFLYVLSNAAISPTAANRALWIRSYITFSWLITGGLAFTTAHFMRSGEPVEAWFVISILVMCISLMAVVSEKDEPSSRVASTIPRSKIRRLMAFFFYSGSANGIAWVLTITVLTFSIFVGELIFKDTISTISFTKSSLDDGLFILFGGFFLYHYCYTMTGLFIQRKFLSKRIPTKATFAVVLGLYAATCLIPILSAIPLGITKITKFLIIDFIINQENAQFAIAAMWAIIITILLLPWFVERFQKFKALSIIENRQQH